MKILFFDTESTSLTGIMGRILCASFLEFGFDSKHVYSIRADRKPWRSRDKIDDRKVVVAIRDELEGANMVVGWNSKLHDVPLLNARLAKAGERPIRLQFHLDLMWYAGGSSMKIGSRKLDNVTKYLDVPDRKTALDWATWQRAAAGDKAAFAEVVEHCEADTLVLSQVYPHLLPYVARLHR